MVELREREAQAELVKHLFLQDDWFADATSELARLAEWRSNPDGAPPIVSIGTLRALNTNVNRAQIEGTIAGSLTATEVIDLLDAVNDRRSVSGREARGKLIGLRRGRSVFYPAWQFDRLTGNTIPGIEAWVTAARGLFGADIVAMDLAVRSPRARLGGGSIVDLLAERKWDGALAELCSAVEQGA